MKHSKITRALVLTAAVLTAAALFSISAFAAKTEDFKDLKADAWYYEAVDYAIKSELMNGVTSTEFSLDASMTRAQLVTVLWRMDGSPSVSNSKAVFTDVQPKSWYEAAVFWAYEKGIVNGVTPTEFAPDESITREQIATIFKRYSDYKNVGVSVISSDIKDYPDYSSVSSYAIEYMSWANGAGLVKGVERDGKDFLDPRADATRAQVAVILFRFASTVMKDVDSGEVENEPLFFYHGNTVAAPGDVVTVTGEYLDVFTSVSVNGKASSLIQPDRNSLKFEIPESLEEGAYKVVLSGGGIRRSITVNEPKIVWIQGDEGEFATPGGWLRVNGECLSIDGEDCAAELISQDGSVTRIDATDVKDEFSVEIALPESLPHGTYTVRYTNGSAASNDFEIKIEAPVRSSWPTNVFNIIDYGAKKNDSAFDNGAALTAALKAARDNGGGVIYFPKGFYQMSSAAFVIPQNTVIRGEGMNLVSIHWGSFEQGGSGWTIKNLPNAIFRSTGNCAIEEITFSGALMPTLLDADGTIRPSDYDKYVSNVYVTNCRVYSNMYAADNGFPKDQENPPKYSDEEVSQYKTNHSMFKMRCQNFQLVGCELQWDSMIMGGNGKFILKYNKNLLMKNNSIIGSSFHTMHDGAIVEDNSILGGTRGDFVYGINGEKVYFARNYMLEGADPMDREIMSSDWNSVSNYHGPITFHDDTHVTFPEAAEGLAGIRSEKESYFLPRVCVMIVNGTGVGQYRYVTKRDGLNLTLESPFDAWDETSEFAVTRMNSNWYFVENYFGYTGDFQFYTSQMDSVVARNETYFAYGFMNWGMEIYGSHQCHWYVTYEGNYMHGGVYQHTFNTDATRMCILINSPVTSNIANTVRRNMFCDLSNFQLVCGSSSSGFGFLAEDNYFENAMRAMYFTDAVPKGTLLTGNKFQDCDVEIQYPKDKSQLLEIN